MWFEQGHDQFRGNENIVKSLTVSEKQFNVREKKEGGKKKKFKHEIGGEK